MGIDIRSKFLGSLTGAALGDAIGASREGLRMVTDKEIRHISKIQHTLRYTDDTHMTIGVAESLIENLGFNGAHMAKRFADNYFREPWRGYGPGPPQIFRLLQNGEAWDKASNHIYPGGSFGNGAAMRVTPVGLLFCNNPEKLREVACQSSLITHSHTLGMEGATLQAFAVAMAVAGNPDEKLNSQAFISRLLGFATEEIYRDKIGIFTAFMERPADRQAVVRLLGHGIEAFNSVPTAMFAFLTHPKDFASTVVYAVSLGGDTDTIASMAGAVSGAYLGIDAIPQEWQEQLENRDYILDLADRLWQLSSGQ